MNYCDCKGTTKLQLLQRVFQRMLTKNQNSQKNGTRFQVANLEDEMFLESLQLQADMEDIETEVFMESLKHEAEMEELENEAFLESLRLQAELEDIAADAMMYL